MDQVSYFVLTANRLLDGRVVWLTPKGYWSVMLEEAHYFSTLQEAEQKQEEIGQTLSAPFLIDLHYAEIRHYADVRKTAQPVTTREKIRAFGPSTHPEFDPRSIQKDS